jgi:hypothetical protein
MHANVTLLGTLVEDDIVGMVSERRLECVHEVRVEMYL